MENIKREIRLFFVYYGKLISFIIGFIAVIILIIQSLNVYTIKQKENINNQYSQEEYEQKQEEKEKKTKDKEYISEFIDYCNEGKIQEAYTMLSDKCKEEKYSTIEEFKKMYVNKIFSINICKYEIIKENDIYVITLTQDMLITGKTNSTIEQKYQVSGVLERRIYIQN